MSESLGLKVFSMVVLMVAFAVTPDGPWYRELGAMLLAGWSAVIWHIAREIAKYGDFRH